MTEELRIMLENWQARIDRAAYEADMPLRGKDPRDRDPNFRCWQRQAAVLHQISQEMDARLGRP